MRAAILGQHVVVLTFAGNEVTLVPGGKVRIGRHSANDLALDSSRVSRFHAEVRWGGDGRAIVADLGSQNGTFVDERPVHGTAVIHDGCRLSVATHAIQVRVESPETPALLDDADEEVTLFAQPERAREGSYESRRELQSMLLDFEELDETGVLELDEGSLVFASGVIVAARAGELSGLDALERVLHGRSGGYRFSTSVAPIDGRIQVSISNYLKAGYWATLGTNLRWRPRQERPTTRRAAPPLDGHLSGRAELEELLQRCEREATTGSIWLRLTGVTFVLTLEAGGAKVLHRNAREVSLTLDELLCASEQGGKFLITHEPFQRSSATSVSLSELLHRAGP